MAASKSTWSIITQSGSNTGQVTSNLRTLNKSARWETTQHVQPCYIVKAYGSPTRASPRLIALRAQAATIPTPKAPVAPAVPAPLTARRTARISVKYYSMKLADRGGPSNVAPVDNDPIEVSSDWSSVRTR
ncbi:hypothetical protein PIB30_068516 [Stylosanthes scabra]|uniref:Uncharacterized protein n=1 Tax=Stylosanthes scabra TaxID=79078 RepID=A0ABU6QMP6_9FABA|nr:hypothetical protein [Stylosanthes scabra]